MPATGNNQILHNLSIRITADGFSFLVTEALSGDIAYREDFKAPNTEQQLQLLTQHIASPALAHYIYNNVRVIVDSPTTCVPASEADHEDLPLLYQRVFSTTHTGQEHVCSTPIEALDTVLLYSIPNAIYYTLLQYYPEATLCSGYALVLQRMAAYCRQNPSPAQPLLAELTDKQLYVFSIHHDKLLFANSFQADNEHDALFFLLSVWKELQLDAHQNTCFIAGNTAEAKHLRDEVRNYILHVESL